MGLYIRKQIVPILLNLGLLVSICTLNVGCKKLIEVDPPINAIIGKDIYKSDHTAASVLTGILTDLSNDKMFAISIDMGMYGEELSYQGAAGSFRDKMYRNMLVGGEEHYWRDYYEMIYRANAAIEGLSESQTLSPKIKNQLIGEARFLRAYLYFYLVNLYGDVPLAFSTDPSVNRVLPRESTDKVYQSIIVDLQAAKALLHNEYVGADAASAVVQRLRPNSAVASALLSRVYLYNKSWDLAEKESSILISDTRYSLETLDKTFTIESKESIWQLQPIIFSYNTTEARTFVLKAGDEFSVPGPDGTNRPVFLSNNIYDEFEINDLRKTAWTDTVHIVENGTGIVLKIYPFANKYKNWKYNQQKTEYPAIFRLAEQYLIRAEAKARQGKLSEATDDLYEVRKRAGLDKEIFSSIDDAVSHILLERRSELFTEYGHRWFDLKRVGALNQQMEKVVTGKGATWLPYKGLLPIPLEDLRTNPSLRGKQNPGYVGL